MRRREKEEDSDEKKFFSQFDPNRFKFPVDPYIEQEVKAIKDEIALLEWQTNKEKKDSIIKNNDDKIVMIDDDDDSDDSDSLQTVYSSGKRKSITQSRNNRNKRQREAIFPIAQDNIDRLREMKEKYEKPPLPGYYRAFSEAVNMPYTDYELNDDEDFIDDNNNNPQHPQQLYIVDQDYRDEPLIQRRRFLDYRYYTWSFNDVELDSTISPIVEQTLVGQIVKGVDHRERTGDTIIIKRIDINLRIEPKISINFLNGMSRVLLVLDKQNNATGADLSILDIMNGATPLALINPQNESRFEILKDWLFKHEIVSNRQVWTQTNNAPGGVITPTSFGFDISGLGLGVSTTSTIAGLGLDLTGPSAGLINGGWTDSGRITGSFGNGALNLPITTNTPAASQLAYRVAFIKEEIDTHIYINYNQQGVDKESLTSNNIFLIFLSDVEPKLNITGFLRILYED